MEKRFKNVVPPAPASFDYAVERALRETEVEDMNPRKIRISIAWALVALLVLAGTAFAVSEYFGLVDYLKMELGESAPQVETQRIDKTITVDGYEMTLQDAYYEDSEITLFFTGEGTDRFEYGFSDLIDVTVEGQEFIGLHDSARNTEGGEYFYMLCLPIEDGGDVETVHITDRNDPTNTFSIELQRSAEAPSPRLKLEATDPTLEEAGLIVAAIDITENMLETNVIINFEQADEVQFPTEHSDVKRYYLDGDMWHCNTDCELRTEADDVDLSAAEIFANDYIPCEACPCLFWLEGMAQPLTSIQDVRFEAGYYDPEIEEFVDVGQADWVWDDNGESVALEMHFDERGIKALKEIDTIYIMAHDFYYSWDFADVAELKFSAAE